MSVPLSRKNVTFKKYRSKSTINLQSRANIERRHKKNCAEYWLTMTRKVGNNDESINKLKGFFQRNEIQSPRLPRLKISHESKVSELPGY